MLLFSCSLNESKERKSKNEKKKRRSGTRRMEIKAQLRCRYALRMILQARSLGTLAGRSFQCLFQ